MSPGEVITIITPRPPDGRVVGQPRENLDDLDATAVWTDARVATPGGTLAYTAAGSGEPLVLIHGLGGTRQTWRHVIGPLAATHRVIAPDLPGHGDSAAPAGDYSLGAHAAAVRDLLVALGHPTATVAGHSLGGGIGMQFAYQFPERISRLILIGSGGLGPELTPILRAATLPGAQTVVAALAYLPRAFTRRLLPVVSLLPGLVARQDARPIAEGLRGLADARQRRAFVRTARTVIGWRGQTVGASRQLGLLGNIPVLVAWGSEDKPSPRTTTRPSHANCSIFTSSRSPAPATTRTRRTRPNSCPPSTTSWNPPHRSNTPKPDGASCSLPTPVPPSLTPLGDRIDFATAAR
jgi:pimeloyl-ACP methyl ester carboxylesterase